MAKIIDHKNSTIRSGFLTLGLITMVLVVGVVAWIGAQNYLNSKSEKDTTEAMASCPENISATNHLWVISGNKFDPTTLSVPRCDTVTVLNQDDRTRYIAFGEHDHHIEYDGLDEQILHSGQSFNFVAVEVGTYRIHDHLDDNAEALLIVSEKN